MKNYLICCVQRCLFLFQIHFWDWPCWQVHWYVCDCSGSVWGGSKYYLFVFASWWFFPPPFAWFMMTFVGAWITVTETDWFMMWYHVEIFLLYWLQKTSLALQEALCSRVGKCPCMSIMTSLSYGQKKMFFYPALPHWWPCLKWQWMVIFHILLLQFLKFQWPLVCF